MLVNASQFPGPALWQGVMLLLMPVVFWGMSFKNGKYSNYISIAYGIFGVLLMIFVISIGFGK